jgi:HTH-type transcriptional regulator, sugar sensing transcriptional regulator
MTIVKEEFLNKLRRYFNLNLYEVRIWAALLSRGVSTAGELSEIGGVPRSRAYDVLESLERRGFVVMKLGKPIQYTAVDPKEVVERVKKGIQKVADDNVTKLKELGKGEVIKELDTLFKQGVEFVDANDLSGAIKGKPNLYSHLETMVKGASKNITLITTAKGAVRKVEALKPILQKLSKKGVKVRIAAPTTKDNLPSLKELKGFADVRDCGKLNARFCIVDNKELMFMVMHDEEIHPSYDVGIWVNTPLFANALSSMVDVAWKDLKAIK